MGRRRDREVETNGETGLESGEPTTSWERAPEVTRAVVDGDPFAASDSLAVLRRLAQEATKSKPPRLGGFHVRRQHRQLRKREERRAATRQTTNPEPRAEQRDPDHTPNWCPTMSVNVLLTADRTCPACNESV